MLPLLALQVAFTWLVLTPGPPEAGTTTFTLVRQAPGISGGPAVKSASSAMITVYDPGARPVNV